jgi:hypothetical protein
VLDLQDLEASCFSNITHEAGGLCQDLVEVLGSQGELTEVSEHLLSLHHLRMNSHRGSHSLATAPLRRGSDPSEPVRYLAGPEQR